MKIIILTGPAASGKNTVSNVLARQKEKCAVIDVDQVRWMYIQPHKAPWDGKEGESQQILGVENACLLTKNFAKNNVDVIILDVLTDETAKMYKKSLGDVKIILLMPSYEETLNRFTGRSHTITDEEFRMVYQWEEKLTVFDEKIDNTGLSVEETAAKIASLT